jgi:hypothetical protein
MLTLLTPLHAIAARRGDGLRPELARLLERGADAPPAVLRLELAGECNQDPGHQAHAEHRDQDVVESPH